MWTGYFGTGQTTVCKSVILQTVVAKKVGAAYGEPQYAKSEEFALLSSHFFIINQRFSGIIMP